MGNVLVNTGGLAAVLDWELCYLGDPAFDLGWLAQRAWRFGEVWEVGGLGTRSELLDTHQANGGVLISLEELGWWEMLAVLCWGMVTMTIVAIPRRGQISSLVQAMIGRRVVEAEYDVMLLLGLKLSGKALA